MPTAAQLIEILGLLQKRKASESSTAVEWKTGAAIEHQNPKDFPILKTYARIDSEKAKTAQKGKSLENLRAA